MIRAFLAACLLLVAAPALAEPADWQRAALGLEQLIDRNYAYRDRLPGDHFRLTEPLRARAAGIGDARAFTRFAEDSLMLLADPHAITSRSLADSWALVPSYADLWIVREGGRYLVTDVRAGSPAAGAGVGSGQQLTKIGDRPVADAVRSFWQELGVTEISDARAGFAARVLAAGRRNQPRRLTVDAQTLTLPSLYATPRPAGRISTFREAGRLWIRFNDSLGDNETIADMDGAMATARPGEAVVLDLTQTPSGGNSSVARAIMGWFTSTPRPYQVHRAIAEERESGIPRQWIEMVLPRAGKFHAGPVSLRVGRWTGSMGEGIAIGMAGWGVDVAGRPMAGLLGAVEDIEAGPDGFTIKLPTERLMATDGTPRENFTPRALAPGEGD